MQSSELGERSGQASEADTAALTGIHTILEALKTLERMASTRKTIQVAADTYKGLYARSRYLNQDQSSALKWLPMQKHNGRRRFTQVIADKSKN